MRRLRRAWHRLTGLLGRGRRQDLQDELNAHLQLHVDDNLRLGMSPEEARRNALVALGGLTQTSEACREQASLPQLETLAQDLRFALRLVRRQPGFAAIIISTLALGIGANTVMFSVVNSLLLQPLPYADASRLMAVQPMEIARWRPARAAAPDFYRYRERNRSFDAVDAYFTRPSNLTGGREPERVPTLIASAGLFDLLGTQMALGRRFVGADEQWGAHRVVVLSAGLWERRFGSDPSIIGRSLTLNGEPFQVVGVLPGGFSFLGIDAQIVIPMSFAPGDHMNSHSNYFLRLVGRLAPGVTRQQAAADVNAILSRIVAEHGVNQGTTIDVVPLRDVVVGRDVRQALLILLGAVAFVLLITCANLANLLLSRAAAREREISVRLALGASRARLVRQFLAESLVFATIGAGLGLVLAYLSVDGLNLVSRQVLPRAGAIRIDQAVLLFSIVLAAATGVLLGLAPAAHSAGTRLYAGLKSASRATTGAPPRQRLRGLLVATEVALTLVLLAGAGLLIRSMYELLHVPAGFDAGGVLTLQLNLPAQKYVDFELNRRGSPLGGVRATAFFEEAIDRIRALPGVHSVGATSGLPLLGEGWGKSLTLWDRPLPRALNGLPSMQYRVVSGDYFEALGIRLLNGRAFTGADTLKAPRVAIVSRELARRFWPRTEDALGKLLSVNPPLSLVPAALVEQARRDGSIPPDYQPDRYTIVGVADDVLYGSLESSPGPVVYVPHAQGAEGTTDMFFAVRIAGDPLALAPAIRQLVAAIDPDQPVSAVQTMDARVAASLAQRRMNMNIMTVFAGMAVLIAVVGIYGVMSYAVTQRSREIGIRLALGAARRDVVGAVMRQGMLMVAAGMGAGLGGAVAVTRFMRSLLYDVSPTDPVVFASILALLALTAGLATYLPARRAAKLDPLQMLRAD